MIEIFGVLFQDWYVGFEVGYILATIIAVYFLTRN